MRFFSKTKKMPSENSKTNYDLSFYDRQSNEPESSVLGSCDYDFSVTRYPKESQLKIFVDAYIARVKRDLGIDVFNCRFERPYRNSDFVNFYIYLTDLDPYLDLGIYYRIEEKEHNLIKIFYEVLKDNKLPAIDTETRLQFLLKSFRKNSQERATYFTWHDIHDEIETVFPEVASLNHWCGFYLFIKDDDFEETIANIEYLKRIKDYCYNATKKHDIDNVFTEDNFHITIDNWKNYEEIGGQHYFNSDRMSGFMKL